MKGIIERRRIKSFIPRRPKGWAAGLIFRAGRLIGANAGLVSGSDYSAGDAKTFYMTRNERFDPTGAL